jgi:nucleotide-binding universal stress UspA family protein
MYILPVSKWPSEFSYHTLLQQAKQVLAHAQAYAQAHAIETQAKVDALVDKATAEIAAKLAETMDAYVAKMLDPDLAVAGEAKTGMLFGSPDELTRAGFKPDRAEPEGGFSWV